MNWLYLIIGFAIGFLTAIFIISRKFMITGYMRVNTKDPDKDLYSLELGCDLNLIVYSKYILLKVIHDD